MFYVVPKSWIAVAGISDFFLEQREQGAAPLLRIEMVRHLGQQAIDSLFYFGGCDHARVCNSERAILPLAVLGSSGTKRMEAHTHCVGSARRTLATSESAAVSAAASVT